MMQATEDSVSDVRALANGILEGDRHQLVGGEWVAGSGDVLAVFDPSTGDRIGELDTAAPDEVSAAVAAGDAAQASWQSLGPYARQRHLEQLSGLIEEHVEELALLDALDSGNPVGAMRRDVNNGIKQLRMMAARGISVYGKTMQTGGPGLHYTVLLPYGTVGRILPFNHPAMFALSKLAAPLVAGNSVVLKPPEQAALSTLRIAQLMSEVLPPGVVNLVIGGAATGNALVTHPAIKRIGFTGSAKTARLIQLAAAETGIKHVSLEAGGKNPMVVTDDADLDAAVEGTVSGMNLLVCQGQSCGSNSRLIVHESVAQEFSEKLAERLGRIRVGVAYNEDTQMGPLVSQEQLDRVTGYVDRAQDDGADVAFGGSWPDGLESGGGYFLSPTLLLESSAESRTMTEEIFGPVMSVLPYSDEEEAIDLANASEYGLTASVWTQDLYRAHRMVDRISAGYVWINEHGPHYVGMPFGGMRNSSVGREESFEEILSYLETKAVHFRF